MQALHGPGGWFARSYFVERGEGNLLVSPLLYRPSIAEWMEDHGGLALIFVTHSDEVGDALPWVGRSSRGPFPRRIPACQYKERFGCQIALHELDATHLEECAVDLAWTDDFRPAPDLLLIHAPRETPGSAALLLHHHGRHILFCGDDLGLDAKGQIISLPTGKPPSPETRKAWSKLLHFRFDALIPLHTRQESPHPFLLGDARAALRQALSALGEE
ncbi:MAG: hypothetical protein ACE5IE_06850 [Dehalococcoidia bacterium]